MSEAHGSGCENDKNVHILRNIYLLIICLDQCIRPYVHGFYNVNC